MTMLLVGAISLVGCSSTSSTSSDTGSTTGPTSTTVSPATTVVGASTSVPPTTVGATAAATTVKVTNPPATTPATAAGPQITSFSVSNPAACAAPDVSVALPPPTVTISWTVTGADSIYVAIDNENGPWETNLAASGSTVVPFACPGPHTYFVVADKAGQPRAVKSKTRP